MTEAATTAADTREAAAVSPPSLPMPPSVRASDASPHGAAAAAVSARVPAVVAAVAPVAPPAVARESSTAGPVQTVVASGLQPVAVGGSTALVASTGAPPRRRAGAGDDNNNDDDDDGDAGDTTFVVGSAPRVATAPTGFSAQAIALARERAVPGSSLSRARGVLDSEAPPVMVELPPIVVPRAAASSSGGPFPTARDMAAWTVAPAGTAAGAAAAATASASPASVAGQHTAARATASVATTTPTAAVVRAMPAGGGAGAAKRGGASGSRSKPAAGRASFLGRPLVDLDSPQGRMLLGQRSINADAVVERREEQLATALDALEREEKLEQAVKLLHKISVKVFVCNQVRVRVRVCVRARFVSCGGVGRVTGPAALRVRSATRRRSSGSRCAPMRITRLSA